MKTEIFKTLVVKCIFHCLVVPFSPTAYISVSKSCTSCFIISYVAIVIVLIYRVF